WSWQDRAEGSIRRGSALDPSTEPVDGIRAFPTAYLPERLLITEADGDDHEAYDREMRALRDAADSFGWRVDFDGPQQARRRIADVPAVIRARITTPDEPTREESPVAPDAWRVLQRARRISRSTMPRTSLEHVVS